MPRITPFSHQNKSVSQKTMPVFRKFCSFFLILRRGIPGQHQAYLGTFGGRSGKGDVVGTGEKLGAGDGG